MKTCLHLSLVVFSLATVIPGFAQEERTVGPTYYRLDFVVKDIDGGKTINSRAYSSMIAPNDRGSIRTGNRVPLPSTSGGGSFSYLEIGVNLDFSVTREMPDRVAVNLTVDISSNAASESPSLPPVLRQNKWSSGVVVPLRKPTTVFSSDDPGSKRQMQVELTATPVK